MKARETIWNVADIMPEKENFRNVSSDPILIELRKQPVNLDRASAFFNSAVRFL